MVLVLLLMLFLALVSFGFWAYTRTLLTSAAADTARYLANADIADTPAAVADRVATLLRGSVAASTSASLACTSTSTGLLVDITCTIRAPGIISLLDGILPDITVTGHSIKESLQ